MPKAKFDFFRVQIGKESTFTFKEALDAIAESPREQSIKIVDGVSCFLTQKLLQQSYSAYLFTKLRMDDLPPRTRLTGERRPLDLDDDEGLGEDVAIAYCEPIQVVSIQRNRHSLSSNMIMHLIGLYAPGIKIKLLPILRPDALERFGSMGILKKLHLKLAGMNNLAFIQNSDLSTNEKVTFQEVLTEPFVDITFSVGRLNTGLTQKIRKIANIFSNAAHSGETDSVLAVEISGKKDDESATTIIDLLQDRLIAEKQVKTKDRSVDTNDLLRVAISTISENYAELQRNT